MKTNYYLYLPPRWGDLQIGTEPGYSRPQHSVKTVIHEWNKPGLEALLSLHDLDLLPSYLQKKYLKLLKSEEN